MGQEREQSMERAFEEAIIAHCEGTATEEQEKLLAEMLQDDPERCRDFLLHLQIHAMLRFKTAKFFKEGKPSCNEVSQPFPEISFYGEQNGFDAESPGSQPFDLGNLNPWGDRDQCESDCSSERKSGTPTWLFSTFTLLARPIPLTLTLLCVLLLPMVMMVWSLNQNRGTTPPACVVSGQVGKMLACKWDETQGVGLRKGDLLTSHREYHLIEGVVELDLASGVKTIIQGPAVFRPKSSMLLELEQGRLTAKVPPKARNFTVAMAGLEVIDRGTEFGISVNKSAEVELHVFKGHVDVLTSNRDQEGKVEEFKLCAGQASCVDRLTGKTRKMAADKSKFIQKFNNESGLNLQLINPSFEEPRVADHPKSLRRYGNLRSAFGLKGWSTIKSSDATGKYPVYLQETPYLADHTGRFKKVQRCTQKAIDGTQMLTMRLGWEKKAWVFQPLGTIRMGDVGKTLVVSTTVVARESIHENVTYYGATATAVLAFTVGTTGESQGKVIGFPGIASGVALDQPSQHLVAELTIEPHMIGKKLAVRLLAKDPDPQKEAKFKDEYDPVNQYFFDAVELKLRHEE